MKVFREELMQLKRWQSIEEDDYLRLHQNENSRLLEHFDPHELSKVLTERWKSKRKAIHYPQMQLPELTESMARYFQVGSENILLTAGSTAAIELIASGLNRKPKTIVTVHPTYFAYARFFKTADSHYKSIRFTPDLSFPEADLLSPDTLNADILILCNPNNPTGGVLSTHALDTLLNSFHGLLIVDEAYIEYASSATRSLTLDACSRKNVLVLRSCSKAVGLASLRVGCMIGHPETLRYFGALQSPYTVADPSQVITDFVLRNYSAVIQSQIQETIKDRMWLENELSGLPGIEVHPTQTNFVLISGPEISQWEDTLAETDKILVKGYDFEGLGSFLRISLSSGRTDLERFLDAVRRLLKT